MNYFGAYHVDIRPQALGICDAPHISKGQMTLSGFETASNARCMVMVYGRMRNRALLARQLNCAPYASQAQILLQAYSEWADECISRIEGPCMFCIADIERDRMMIVRDRMGETAVFYACRAGALVFADHPDMILKSAFIEPVMDKDGLCELFGMGPARTPGKTPIRGLNCLQPGCILVCEAGEFNVQRYFEIEPQTHDESEESTAEHVRMLLENAVEDIVHLHPACMLSGGIDSTALTALLSTRIGRLHTFSVDYRDNENDFVANAFRPEMDAPYIQQAVRAFGTQHRSIVLEQDALAEALTRAMRARGFPGMADIDSSLYLFAREIVRGTPSVVSGECGDEVFGGYPWFRDDYHNKTGCFPWSGSIQLRESILRPEIREKLHMKEYVQQVYDTAMGAYDVSCIDGDDEKKRFRLQRLCFDFFMANLQERAVKMCDVHGLQVLTPLCDDRLVRYVYSVPWRIKQMHGMEKGLLRAAVRDLVPEKLRKRKKSPYPKTCSAAYTSIIRGKIRTICASANEPIWQIVDRGRIEFLAASSLDPAEMPWFGQLMAGPQMLAYLLQINSWMKERNIALEIE